MIVKFVDIGGIVDHHCLEEIIGFVDIVDHHYLEDIVRFVNIGCIVDNGCLNFLFIRDLITLHALVLT